MSSAQDVSLSSDDVSDECDNINFKGDILNKKYIILDKLGSGAFASVWIAYNVMDKKFYAIKIQNSDDYEEGLEEIELFKKIQKTDCKYLNSLHEHFIHTSNKTDGQHVCMVSELMTGSVYDIIRGGKYSNGMTLDFSIRAIWQTLNAMDVLDSKLGIIHTDIKPENILLAGVDGLSSELIEKFNKLNLHKVYKKKKIQSKKKKNSAIEETAKTIIKSLYDQNINSLDDSLSDDYGSESDEATKVVSKKYIKECRVLLSDFGNCLEKSRNKFEEIQTRHYRAPEVILGYPYNEKCDIWSVGCMLYELLTGEILFNPGKKRGFNRDRHHIYDMHCLLGQIPKDLLSNSSKRTVFYKKSGLLKGVKTIEYTPFKTFLKNKTKNKAMTETQFDLLCDFLSKTICYHPKDRMSAKKCMNHKLFQDIK